MIENGQVTIEREHEQVIFTLSLQDAYAGIEVYDRLIASANSGYLKPEVGGRPKPPGDWMNEQTGVLCAAIEAYLEWRAMTPEQIAAMRAYLRQWIAAPEWSEADELRREVNEAISA
jgi:hypothetical protein